MLVLSPHLSRVLGVLPPLWLAATATTEDQRFQRGQRIQTKGLLEMRSARRNNERVVKTAEARAARFKEGLEGCLW